MSTKRIQTLTALWIPLLQRSIAITREQISIVRREAKIKYCTWMALKLPSKTKTKEPCWFILGASNEKKDKILLVSPIDNFHLKDWDSRCSTWFTIAKKVKSLGHYMRVLRTSFPVSTLHMRIVSSSDPEYRGLLSEVRTHELTSSMCPENVFMHWVWVSQQIYNGLF